MANSFQSMSLDKQVTKEEYFDRDRYYPEERFYSEKVPERGVAGRGTGSQDKYEDVYDKRKEMRPIGENLGMPTVIQPSYVNKSTIPVHSNYYQSERYSEPSRRGYGPESYLAHSTRPNIVREGEISPVDKGLEKKREKYLPGANLPREEIADWKHQAAPGRQNVSYENAYSSWTTPGKRFEGLRKPVYERDYPYTGSRPSSMLARVGQDIYTTMGGHPQKRAFDVEPSYHDIYSDDPSEIIEALIKVQRVNPITGVTEPFHSEGLSTTLRIHRSSLFEHGLTSKEEGVLAFLMRKKLDLDSLIGFDTKNALKRSLGLGPRDNIRLEPLPSTISITDTSRGADAYRKPIVGQNKYFGERDYSQKRFYSPAHQNYSMDYRSERPVRSGPVGGGALGEREFEGRSHGYHDGYGYEDRREEEWRDEEHVHGKKPSQMKRFVAGIKSAIKGPKYTGPFYEAERYPEERGYYEDYNRESKWEKRDPMWEKREYREPIREHPMSFEEKSYGYSKSEKPYLPSKYGVREDEFYNEKSRKIGQSDFHDKGYFERPGQFEREFPQRVGESYDRY